MPEVTVVIPCYCCVKTIERAVASVYTQTLRPAEIILVDDCSFDKTLDKLREIKEYYPPGWVKVIELPRNVGPGEARNAGWEAATHPYIAFLDADDSWHTQKIEIQYGWMSEHPEVSLTGHAFRQIHADRERAVCVNFKRENAFFTPVFKRQLLLSNYFSTPTVMMRRDLPMRFAKGKRFCEDYLLWCEICCAKLSCYYCELPLTYLYKDAYGAGGLSGDLRKMQNGELEVYRRLYQDKCYGMWSFLFLASFSHLKYFRRILKTKFFRSGAL
ncbi:glycosyltransferase family 2 protein [Desulfurivibrio sp. C05AmB]|uniref:glycosyltransferase family 2 protein n=1 Tax=Desulfurivibrio sp. C05AmB TaxID=3374371 RepID=UPI00376F3782